MRLRHLFALGSLFLGCLVAASPVMADPAAAPALQASDQPFRRGVNVLGYDPYWNKGGKPRFQWRHFDEIHRAGFDFVRVNLQAFRHMNSKNRLEPQWLAKLDEVVCEAERAGLGIILDEHDFNICSSDVDLCRAKLLAFWEQVAPRYSNAPRSLAFELLNEPHDKLDGEVWNGLFAETLAVVRKTNPTRIVVVGPSHWNNLNDLPLLKLPPDPNLLVTFHYYEPFHFTHQGATWAGEEVKRLHGVTWGSDQDRAAIRSDFDKVAAWSKANQRPILLGEFGAYDKSGTPLDLRVAYIAADRGEAERHGFGWAYWQFEGDFVVWDMPSQRWIEPILKALVP
ncbi:MAG TPA: glycoside hydrolase family 5 protein [Sphingomicrobium sp.]|nr:glycoside hydrolase family 5 protein [Sphingomicrobium sp.]